MIDTIKKYLADETAKLDILKESLFEYEFALDDYEGYKEYCTFFNREVKSISLLEENLKIAYKYTNDFSRVTV